MPIIIKTAVPLIPGTMEQIASNIPEMKYSKKDRKGVDIDGNTVPKEELEMNINIIIIKNEIILSYQVVFFISFKIGIIPLIIIPKNKKIVCK